MPRVGEPFNPYRIFHGYHVPECIMPYKGITPGAKLCLAVLYRFIGKHENAWPGQESIAKRLGVSDRQTRDYINELRDDGFIESKARGQGKTAVYQALWHPVFESDTPVQDRSYSSSPDRKQSSGQERKDSSGPSYRTEESQVKESQDEEVYASYLPPSEEERDLQPSTTAREQGSFSEYCDPADIVSRFTAFRGFKRPSRSDRAKAIASMEERRISLTGDELATALEGYRDSDWAKKNGYPLLGFTKDPRSWVGRERPKLPFEDLARELREKVPVKAVSASVVQSQAGEPWSPAFQGYLDDLGASGKRIEYAKADEAYRIYWPHGNEEWQTLCREDAKYLAEKRKDNPEMVPNPVNHLKSQPWLNIRKKKKTEEEEAWEDYYRMHPEERPSV